jgi:hypothetical protein
MPIWRGFLLVQYKRENKKKAHLSMRLLPLIAEAGVTPLRA